MQKLVHKKTGLEISHSAILNKPNMVTAGVMCGAIGCIPTHPLTVSGMENNILNTAIRKSLDKQEHGHYAFDTSFHGHRGDMYVDEFALFNKMNLNTLICEGAKPKPYKVNTVIGIGSLEGFSGNYIPKATILYNPNAHHELTSIARRNLEICKFEKMSLNIITRPLLNLNENYHLDSLIGILEDKVEAKVYRVYSKTLELIFSNASEGVGFKKYSRDPVVNYTASWLKFLHKKNK